MPKESCRRHCRRVRHLEMRCGGGGQKLTCILMRLAGGSLLGFYIRKHLQGRNGLLVVLFVGSLKVGSLLFSGIDLSMHLTLIPLILGNHATTHKLNSLITIISFVELRIFKNSLTVSFVDCSILQSVPLPAARGLGWVDLNFECSTVCPILPRLMGIWQKELGKCARWLSTQINVNPTQVHKQMGHPV